MFLLFEFPFEQVHNSLLISSFIELNRRFKTCSFYSCMRDMVLPHKIILQYNLCMQQHYSEKESVGISEMPKGCPVQKKAKEPV